jgi:hypothetical protein
MCPAPPVLFLCYFEDKVLPFVHAKAYFRLPAFAAMIGSHSQTQLFFLRCGLANFSSSFLFIYFWPGLA